MQNVKAEQSGVFSRGPAAVSTSDVRFFYRTVLQFELKFCFFFSNEINEYVMGWRVISASRQDAYGPSDAS